MKVKKNKVKLITLGCSKNLVDSEFILSQIKSSDIEIVEDEELAENVIINTCGFIQAAKEESIETILRAVERKEKGLLKSVYVAGCLSDRYMEDLKKEIPSVDKYFGATDKPHTIAGILNELGIDYKSELLGEREVSTPSHFAYLKISEGCDNPCSFCAIPLMRGAHRSKPLENIVTEAQKLASKGVKELIVIGQDTTYWGFDIDRKRRLSEVLRALSEINGIEWIRLMYAYPSRFPEDLADTMLELNNVCNYIDIPIQHITENMLKSMRRGITGGNLRALLYGLKEKIPGLAVRTTLITGYPGETEKDFSELVDFVREFKFHRLGVFTYSHEEDTTAYELRDDVPSATKLERQKILLDEQRKISLERNLGLIGKDVKVIIDKNENGFSIGRTEHDAPEIDQEVIISTDGLIHGEFVSARIHDAEEFDLFASVSENLNQYLINSDKSNKEIYHEE